MDENDISTGAGPALAAHSKDASAPGPTAASSAVGQSGHSEGPAEGQMQQAYGQAVDQVRDLATENPIGALGVAAAVGLFIGLVVGRR